MPNLNGLAQELAPALTGWFLRNDTFYATGTWTPVLAGDATAGTFTYDTTNTGGWWTRTGNRVHVQGRVRVTAITGAPSGNMYISLPALAVPSPMFNVAGGGTMLYWTGITLPAGYTAAQYLVFGGLARLYMVCAGSGVGGTNITSGNIALVGGLLDFPFIGSFCAA